eukprot:Gb_38252 [translate_table: standard]
MSTRRRSQRWWCHQCSRRIRASDATANQLDCPYCHGGFVEEIDDSEGHGGNFDGEEEAAMTQMMHSLATFLEQVPHNQRGFNPILLLQGQMQDLAEDAILFNNEGQRRMRHGNIGDYFLGPGLDQLIQELAENYPNRHGASPASKASVEAMETVKITNRDPLGTADAAQCAVCKDEFEVGIDVKRMPCRHMYHSDCILPWLAHHNSCPVCRYEMPTDDSEYDGLRASGRNNSAPSARTANSGGGFLNRSDTQIDNTAAANTPNQQSANSLSTAPGRRLSIRRICPLRASATTSQQAQAETSSGPANSGETVSSQLNDTQGYNSEGPRTDEDGDTIMSEAREQLLD